MSIENLGGHNHNVGKQSINEMKMKIKGEKHKG
jgi:hypothetical protein